MQMRFKKYTKENLIEAVKSSTSIRQVLFKLHVAEHGGNYATIKRYIQLLELDTSHFLGRAINRGKLIGPKRPITDYLSNNFPIKSHRLRLRLIREGHFEHKCYCCGLSKWMGKPISLELEHIDGNHSNNLLENLTLLCPNCHAQTSTYRGRKTRKISKASLGITS